MFSKIKEYLWPSNQSNEQKQSNEEKTETHSNTDNLSIRYYVEEQQWGREPETPREKNPDGVEQKQSNEEKTETPREKNRNGASRFKDVDRSNFEEIENEANKFWGNQGVQFLGGLAAGIYFTVTDKPLVLPPPDNKYMQENRQEFADRLAKAAEDPLVQASPNATAAVRLMQGQNNFQEIAGQDLPHNTIDLFLDNVYAHAELDKEAREQGLQVADHNEHKNCASEQHDRIKEGFKKSGYPSGQTLHGIGKIKEELAKEGEVVFPTGSHEDSYWRSYTKEDYEKKRSENKAKEEPTTSYIVSDNSNKASETKRSLVSWLFTTNALSPSVKSSSDNQVVEKEVESTTISDTTWSNSSSDTTLNKYSSDSETENDSVTEEETVTPNSGYDPQSHQWDSESESETEEASVTECPATFFASSNNETTSESETEEASVTDEEDNNQEDNNQEDNTDYHKFLSLSGE